MGCRTLTTVLCGSLVQKTLLSDVLCIKFVTNVKPLLAKKKILSELDKSNTQQIAIGKLLKKKNKLAS